MYLRRIPSKDQLQNVYASAKKPYREKHVNSGATIIKIWKNNTYNIKIYLSMNKYFYIITPIQ